MDGLSVFRKKIDDLSLEEKDGKSVTRYSFVEEFDKSRDNQVNITRVELGGVDKKYLNALNENDRLEIGKRVNEIYHLIYSGNENENFKLVNTKLSTSQPTTLELDKQNKIGKKNREIKKIILDAYNRTHETKDVDKENRVPRDTKGVKGKKTSTMRQDIAALLKGMASQQKQVEALLGQIANQEKGKEALQARIGSLLMATEAQQEQIEELINLLKSSIEIQFKNKSNTTEETQELVQLRKELVSLTEEQKKLATQQEKLRKQNKKLESAKAQMRKGIESYQKSKKMLTDEIERLKSENEQLEAKITSLEETNKNLTKTLSSSVADAEAQGRTIEKLQKQIKTNLTQIDKLNLEIAELMKSVKSEKEKNDKLGQENESALADNKGLKELNKRTKQSLVDLNQKIKEQENSIRQLNGEIQRAKAEAAKKIEKNAYEKLQVSLISEKEKNETLSNTNNKIASSVQFLALENKRLKSSNEDITAENTQLREENRRVSEKIDELTSNLRLKSTELEDLKAQIEHLNRQKDSIQSQLKQAQASNQQLQSDLEQEKITYAKLKEQLAQVLGELSQLREALNAKDREIEILNNQLAEEKSKEKVITQVLQGIPEEQHRALQSQLEALRAELKELTDSKLKLEQELLDLLERQKVDSAEKMQLQAENEQEKLSHAESRNQIEQIKASLNSLQQNIQSKESNIQQLTDDFSRERQSAVEQHQALQSQVSSLSEELDANRVSTAQQKSKFEKMLQKQNEGAVAEKERLESEKNQERLSHAETKVQLAKLKDEFAEERSKVTQVFQGVTKEEHEAMQLRLAKSNEELSELKRAKAIQEEELLSTKQQLAELESQNAQLATLQLELQRQNGIVQGYQETLLSLIKLLKSNGADISVETELSENPLKMVGELVHSLVETVRQKKLKIDEKVKRIQEDAASNAQRAAQTVEDLQSQLTAKSQQTQQLQREIEQLCNTNLKLNELLKEISSKYNSSEQALINQKELEEQIINLEALLSEKNEEIRKKEAENERFKFESKEKNELNLEQQKRIDEQEKEIRSITQSALKAQALADQTINTLNQDNTRMARDLEEAQSELSKVIAATETKKQMEQKLATFESEVQLWKAQIEGLNDDLQEKLELAQLEKELMESKYVQLRFDTFSIEKTWEDVNERIQQLPDVNHLNATFLQIVGDMSKITTNTTSVPDFETKKALVERFDNLLKDIDEMNNKKIAEEESVEVE